MSDEPLHIVRAGPEDAPRLTALALAAKRHWGYPERWIAAWHNALTFTPAFIAEHEVFAAVEDGAMIGVYALGGGGPVRTLEHFWVHPEAMGRGVGRRLFTHAVERVAARGGSCLEIEADPNAEGFYRRMGARRTGERVYPIDDQLRTLPLLEYRVEG